MEEFFTADAAEEGVKLPLQTPDGKETNHWLVVRGIDSDVFREAESTAKRKAMQLGDDKDRDRKYNEIQNHVIASLIKDWSFDMPCNKKNKMEFLKKAPQIGEVVNRFAGNRGVFFKTRAKNSSSGSDTSEN